MKTSEGQFIGGLCADICGESMEQLMECVCVWLHVYV